MYINGYVT